MTEFLIFLGGLATGGIVGWWLCWRRQQTTINGLLFSTVVLMQELNIDRADLDRLLENATDQDSVPEIKIKIEQHSGKLYAYRKDTGEFLAQGVDKEELIAELTRLNLSVRLVTTAEDGSGLIEDPMGPTIGTD